VLKTFDILLDIEKELYTMANILFSVSMNDNDTIQLNFEIKQDEEPMNLTNTTVELAVKKPSGKTVFQAAEVTDAEKGLASIRLSEQAFVEFGTHKAEVYVRQGERLAVTSAFWYSSRLAIMQGEEIESVHEWSAFHEALLAYDKKPLLVDGVPTATPEYIGQIAFDYENQRVFIAYAESAESWQIIGGGEGGTGVVRWNDILNKPVEFAPEAHLHSIEDIEGLQDALEQENETGTAVVDWADVQNKPEAFPAEAHVHDWAEVENKPTAFTPEAHMHNINEVEGLQAALDAKADEGQIGAPEEHTHEIDEVNGLQAALDAKAAAADVYTKEEIDQLTFNEEGSNVVVENNLNSNSTSNALAANQGRILNEKINTKADAEHVHDWADIEGKPTTFAPEEHAHDIEDIVDLQRQLETKATVEELDEKADLEHVHEILEVEGLQAALDGKAAVEELDEKADLIHVHDWADIENKPTSFAPEAHVHDWAEVENKPTTFAPEAHVHEISEVAGLQDELDAKAAAADLAAKADAEHVHDWADIEGKPTTFAPEAHVHDWADIAGKPTEFKPEAHVHDWAEVENKPTTFTPEAHVHDWAEVENKPTAFTPEAHVHEMNEVNGLQAALDAKAAAADLENKTNKDYVDAADNYILNDVLKGLSFWRGTQAEYDALAVKNADTIYFVS
jgi:hypothetical protein